MRELIASFGADRVMFGTDYPMWDPGDEISRFEKLELDAGTRKSILYNNASRLFGV